MSKDIFISVLVSSNKPYVWTRFLSSLFEDSIKIPIEVIFVGPARPSFKLPPSCRFVKSKVKPSQCFEIAARRARGDYFLFSPDDVTFSKNFINKSYNYIKRETSKKVVFCSGLRKRFKGKTNSIIMKQKMKKKH